MRPPYRAKAMIKVMPLAELRPLQRRWLDAEVTDSANENRVLKAVSWSAGPGAPADQQFSFTAAEVKHCAAAPLTPAGLDKHIKFRPKDGAGGRGAADALAARVDGRVETRRARCAAMGRILRDDASRSTRPAAPGESPPGESPPGESPPGESPPGASSAVGRGGTSGRPSSEVTSAPPRASCIRQSASTVRLCASGSPPSKPRSACDLQYSRNASTLSR